MTYKCTQSNNQHNTLIEGNGRTEAEELVNTFARKADITIDEGFKIIEDRSNHGVTPAKAAKFCEAVRDEYGSLDCLQISCAALTPKLA